MNYQKNKRLNYIMIISRTSSVTIFRKHSLSLQIFPIISAIMHMGQALNGISAVIMQTAKAGKLGKHFLIQISISILLSISISATDCSKKSHPKAMAEEKAVMRHA